ncbi:MAG TPA: hypothetical protein VN958_14355 [Chitinophagaceae bacterium]|nr:hypothetical protein [Chitinophagaceae bacterium]
MDWKFFIGLSDVYMPLLTLILFIAIKKHIPAKENLLLAYLLLNVITFGVTDIMVAYKIHNSVIYHFYSLLELCILIPYLKSFLPKNKLSKTGIEIIILYFIFWMLNIFLWESLDTFNSYGASVSNLIILIFCLSNMLQLAKSDEVLYFQRSPAFWIISGFLFSSAINIMVFVSYKYYTLNKVDGRMIWLISSFATIIKFVLISAGLLWYKTRQSTQRLLL